MTRIVVVTSGKGGVGKTTTSASFSAGLAMRGHKTAVIDFDVGLRNLDLIMGCERRVVYDFVNVIQGEASLKQALIKDKQLENLFILPASQTRDKDALDPEVFKEVVKGLLEEEGFDRVLIDSPAGIESGFRTAAAPAEGALVVVNPEVSSVRDADRIIGLLEAQQITEIRLVVNRLRPKMVASGNMLSIDDMVDILGVKPIGIVPEDEGIIVSTNVGEPAVLGKTKAGDAFMATAQRIQGQDVPFPKLTEEEKGIWAAIRRLFGGGS